MARATTHHVCSACGHESAKWHGRCPGCEEWGTLVEEARPPTPAGPTGRAGAGRGRALTPVPLGQVEAPSVARLRTGIGELDRVLGGGLVPGSLVLLGGSPGIGKSTIVTSALGNLAAAGRRTLYVSGEESAAQVRLRAERLGPPRSPFRSSPRPTSTPWSRRSRRSARTSASSTRSRCCTPAR